MNAGLKDHPTEAFASLCHVKFPSLRDLDEEHESVVVDGRTFVRSSRTMQHAIVIATVIAVIIDVTTRALYSYYCR